MTMTAEQVAELEAATPNENDAEESIPASGEQPTEETAAPEESAAEESEAGSDETGGEKPAAEPKPEEQRAWRAVEAAKREQIKSAQAREKLARDAERVRQYEAQVNAEREKWTRDLDAREARVKPLQEALERKDLTALAALGFDFESFAREAMTANTPEGIARRAQQRVEQLEKERREEREQREARERQERQVAVTREQANTLVKLAEDHADQCPELYAWAPDRIAVEGIAVRDAFRNQQGRWPTYEQVINELRRRARAEATTQKERLSALEQRKSAKSSDAGSAGKVDPNRQRQGGNPPALSGRTAAERPSPPREKTDAELDEECLADLRSLRRR